MRIIITKKYAQQYTDVTQDFSPTGEPVPSQYAQPQQNQFNPNHISLFATNLRNQVNNFVSNLNKIETPEQALQQMEKIQTITQQIIASIQQGSRKTVVTNPEAVQQVKQPLF